MNVLLGLPEATELNRPLPKKAIFNKFKPSIAERRRFDADIWRFAIVNEVSPATTTIAAGASAGVFYLVLVSLRGADCDAKSLAKLSSLIGQNMLFVLESAGKARLAVFRPTMQRKAL
jgi:hypothetical protein